jgi:hypothetical protein
MCRIFLNIFDSQSWTLDKGWSSNLRVGRGGQITPHCKVIMYKEV